METFNIHTKKWKKIKMPADEEIRAIVGKGVKISVDSLGNITIDKKLSAEERAEIEKL